MSAPACELCASGATKRILGQHLEVSERGERAVGACTAPDAALGSRAPEYPFARKYADWCRRVREELGKPVNDPPPLLAYRAAEREPGEDDGDERTEAT